ncbi:hypothetical protein DPEC_G00250490 [Dallia pectoralis]|uniref:Uncharacterized protein n=1 Tax=Dallia pectoralis TaxID=75939 RepID=A0ACC2FT77_DALPE|nr:hypothetical protein DPEC_G00250490 [Dallia pectoralis]
MLMHSWMYTVDGVGQTIYQVPSTMLSRLQASSSPISPVLFLTVDGEPMRFFLRPGPTKVQLQPVIKAGGGLVCRAQEPGALLLAEPDEMVSVTGSAAHGYVSAQYIRDCVEKNQQLEVEDYLFKPVDPEVSILSRSLRKSGTTSGRMLYTAEEDADILKYVSEHAGEVRGNIFWQEMKKNGLTNHSWQSMKDRYRKYLKYRQPKTAASAPEEKQGNVSVNDTTPSPQSDSPQCFSDVIPKSTSDTPNTSPEAICSQVSPAKHLQLHRTSCPVNQTQRSTEGPRTEVRPVEHETATLPQPETERSMSGKTPPGPAWPDGTMTQWVPSKTIHRPSPGGEHPWPGCEQAVVPRSPKRARSHSEVAMVEVVLGKLTYLSPEAITSNATEGQLGMKRAKKRKLGILERAVREFEASDQSVDDDDDDDETPDLAESAAPLGPSSATPHDQESQTSATVPQSERGPPKTKKQHQSPGREKHTETQPEYQPPEARGPAATDTSIPVPENTGLQSSFATLGTPVPNAVPSTSGAPHLFLFEHESQQVEENESSQPFTQVQLDQAKQLLLSLIEDTKLGLVDITKALLKNSGDVSAALQDPLIVANLGGGAWQGPRWERHDDRLLLSGDLSELQKKFGEKGVARRLAFLDAE